MNILHVTPSFFPATWWGGPIWSTKAICDGIHATPDIDLRVLTTDAASPRIGDRVNPGTLPYPVQHARRLAGHSIAPGLLAQLPGAIRWADLVHLTGTYSFPTLPTLALARLLGRPVVWSPRGALQATEDWGAAPRKRIKTLFAKAAQALRPAQSVLHATSAAEAASSVRHLRGIDSAVIPNCVDIPALSHRPPQSDQLRLMYLGRLHPKKGLDLLFDSVDQLPAHVTLDVYGTGAPDYVATLRARAHERIRLHGHVDAAAKTRAFANADLFILPSHSENFGIAVAEALAHAVPVLTTQDTPWQALDPQGCGRCIALAQTDLATEIARLGAADLRQMGQKGRAWMQQDFTAAAMTAAFVQLYRGMQMPVEGAVLA